MKKMSKGELKKRLIQYADKRKVLKINLPDYRIEEILDEAKKDIYESIESRIRQLIEFWEDDEVNPEILREVKTYYIDAYVSLLHNHNDHDSFKIKKWFGKK